FFFHAEDGIRDLHVTGVQTCALPISRRRASTAGPGHGGRRRRGRGAGRRGTSRARGGTRRRGRCAATSAAAPPVPARRVPGGSEIGRASWRDRVRVSGVGVTAAGPNT